MSFCVPRAFTERVRPTAATLIRDVELPVCGIYRIQRARSWISAMRRD